MSARRLYQCKSSCTRPLWRQHSKPVPSFNNSNNNNTINVHNNWTLVQSQLPYRRSFSSSFVPAPPPARNLLLVGAPGSGKGTVGQKLVDAYGLRAIGAGDTLRRAVAVEQTTDFNHGILSKEKDVADSLGSSPVVDAVEAVIDGVAPSLCSGVKNVIVNVNVNVNINSVVPTMRLRELLERGEFVPDDVILPLITRELARAHADGLGWILDGLPRTVSQALALEEAFKMGVFGSPLHHVYFLDISEHIVFERLSHRWVHIPSGRIYHDEFCPPKVRGVDDITGEKLVRRADDVNLDAVRRRLEDYHEKTEPLLSFYENRGILTRIFAPSSAIAFSTIRHHLATLSSEKGSEMGGKE